MGRSSRTTRSPVDVDELIQVGVDAGLSAVGVCSARSWTHTRGLLEERKADGLAGSMAFTYRKPARSSDPSRLLGGARSLVVGAMSYAQIVPPRPDRPSARVARYATSDHYDRLNIALGAMASHLSGLGHRALVVSDDNGLVDREAAWRAGLGFSGKSSNVLLPGQGSWFVLGSVVTDVALASTGPPVAEECGSCRRCLDGCPTGAIVAPGVVDARRCLAWMLQAPGDFPRQYRETLGDRIYGCDDCQEVCPPNRRVEVALRTRVHAGDAGDEPADPGAWVDVAEALALDDDTLLDRFGRWYLPGRDVAVLRRNLLVVAGNSTPPVPATLGRQIARHLRHLSDVVAAHAAWAAIRLGRSDLLDDPEVARRPAIVAERTALLGDRGTTLANGDLAAANGHREDLPS